MSTFIRDSDYNDTTPLVLSDPIAENGCVRRNITLHGKRVTIFVPDFTGRLCVLDNGLSFVLATADQPLGKLLDAIRSRFIRELQLDKSKFKEENNRSEQSLYLWVNRKAKLTNANAEPISYTSIQDKDVKMILFLEIRAIVVGDDAGEYKLRTGISHMAVQDAEGVNS